VFGGGGKEEGIISYQIKVEGKKGKKRKMLLIWQRCRKEDGGKRKKGREMAQGVFLSLLGLQLGGERKTRALRFEVLFEV